MAHQKGADSGLTKEKTTSPPEKSFSLMEAGKSFHGELSEDELKSVSGGVVKASAHLFNLCATGQHIQQAIVSTR
jgi:bacteriocin-like protein